MQKHSCQSQGTFVSPVPGAADWRQNRATPWAPMNCAPRSQHVWARQWVPGRSREVLECRSGISYQLQWAAHAAHRERGFADAQQCSAHWPAASSASRWSASLSSCIGAACCNSWGWHLSSHTALVSDRACRHLLNEWWLWRNFPEPDYTLLWLVFPICKHAAAFTLWGAERGRTEIFRGCV